MSKIVALYINEMIKIWKKLSTIVLVCIMIVGIILIGVFAFIQEKNQKTYTNTEFNSGNDWYKDSINSRILELKKQLDDINTKIKSASEFDIFNLKVEKEKLEVEISAYEMALNKGINVDSQSYLAWAFRYYVDLKTGLVFLNNLPNEAIYDEQKKEIANKKQLLAKFEHLLESKDFKEYITLNNEVIKNDTAFSQEEKNLLLEMNELRLKYNITGDQTTKEQNEQISQIETIERLKRGLIYNVDYFSGQEKPMTPEMRKQTQDKIAIALYKLDNKIYSAIYGNNKEIAAQAMNGFGMFIIIVLMLILAGGAVSSEISNGSIKSLIISPTKRWKIFIAKILSLITVGIAVTLVLYLATILTLGFTFSFSKTTPYIYAVNGVAHELSFYLFSFFKMFVNFLDVIVYMLFALMLSVITRNTAASVALSIAVYFGGSILNPFILSITKGDYWLRFIPFYNFSLSSRVFPDLSDIYFNAGTIQAMLNIPVGFSLIYIAVLILCMGYTALDSFNRRDIK